MQERGRGFGPTERRIQKRLEQQNRRSVYCFVFVILYCFYCFGWLSIQAPLETGGRTFRVSSGLGFVRV